MSNSWVRTCPPAPRGTFFACERQASASCGPQGQENYDRTYNHIPSETSTFLYRHTTQNGGVLAILRAVS